MKPESITVDPTSGHILVSESYGTTLGIFTSAGSPVTTYTAASSQMNQIGRIGGMVVDQAGNVFIVDETNNRVVVFDSSMSFQYQFGSSAPATGVGNGEFAFPFGIALDNGESASASVYVTDLGNNRVQKFTHSGAYVLQWGSFASAEPAPYYSDMGSIATDISNNVYIDTCCGSKVFKFDSNGGPTTVFYAPEWFVPFSVDPQYRGIAIDPSGNIYVACGTYPSPRACLRKSDPSWNFLGDTTASGSGSGHLYIPDGVAMDGSGKIYLTDAGNETVEVYSP